MLSLLLAPEDRVAVLDELAELYELRCARWGRGEAERWYRRQVARFAWALLLHGRRSGVGRGRRRSHLAIYDARNGRGETMMRWTDEGTQAVRRLARAPVFTVVASATLAVGIGAFTSIFSLVDAVILEPVPYEDPEELAWVWRDYVEADFPRGWLGGPDVAGLMEQPEVFTGVVAFRSGGLNLAGFDGTGPSQVVVHYHTAGLFEILGVPLYLGREPSAVEAVPDGPEVAVASYELWRTQLGSDPAILGRSISLNGVSTEVIGVAPPDFRFVKHGSLVDPQPADLYMPLGQDLAAQDPGSGAYAALARVAPDVVPDRLEAALERAAEPTNAAFMQFDGSPVRLWTVGLEEDLVAPVRAALTALLGAATFLMLVLAANLATLLIGRAAERERELGVRVALGAGRSRIVSNVLAESAVLATIGASIGLGLAWLGTDVIVRLAPDDLPRLASVGLDASVLAAAAIVAALLALGTGLLPAVHAFRAETVSALKDGGSRSGSGRRAARTRGFLVATQMALSLMLLVGAAVTGRAFARLLDEDPGFDTGGTLTFGVPLPGARYDREAILALNAQLESRLEGLPGVRAVGATTALPLTLATNQRGASFPGAPGNTGDASEDEPLTDNFRVSPGYFEAAGHRLLAGRDFGSLDEDSTVFSVVIDDVLAERFFPDGGAVGGSMSMFGDTATIVGVVDHARLYNVHSDDRGQVYLPLRRFPTTSVSYAVRADVDPVSLVPEARAILRSLDPDVPVTRVRTLEQIREGSLGRQRLSLTLILTFALGAFVLAVLGVYGVVSNTVVRRTHEIGVRIALGASRESVVKLVLRQGTALAVVGVLVGTVGALASRRVLEGVVVGVDPGDPRVYLAVAAILVGVATLASYVPARRATRIDPSEALRPE